MKRCVSSSTDAVAETLGTQDAVAAERKRQDDLLLAQRDSIALNTARARVRELEEMVQRINQSVPDRAAMEVCAQLAVMEPEDNETRLCLFCFERPRRHRPECVWQQAVSITAKAKAMAARRKG